MTQAELHTLLETTNLQVAYHHFKTTQVPSYIVFLRSYDNNISADNKVWSKAKNYQIELYTNKKDLVTELILETVLDGADIFYSTSETYIDTENLYQIVYEIQI